MTIKLFDHQKAGLKLLAEHDSFGLFWDMGSGKTLVMLLHLSDLMLSCEVAKALWLAPKSALGAVKRDLEVMRKHGLGYRADVLEEGLVCLNYEKLSRTNSSWRKMVDGEQWDAIILDEAHCIARPTSNRTKYIIGSGRSKGLIDSIPYRFALTGTPVTNSRLEDFWSFLKLMNGGAYYNYPSFEREFLKTRNLPGTYVKLITGYKNENVLLSDVSSYSQSISKADCMDLPEQMPDNVVMIPWKTSVNNISGMSTKAMYEEALNENIVEMTEEVFDNPLVRSLRLRQIATGHLISDGEGVTLRNEKLEYAMELIKNNHHKTVVFYEFKHSFKVLTDKLRSSKIPFMYLNGEQDDKNIWMQFQESSDDECRVFLTQYKSGNAGIDLYTASDTIYYEPCNSSTTLDQSRSRTHRNGVSRACTYTFLLTEESIEVDMYNALKAHEDFNEKVWFELKRREFENVED